MSAFREAMRVRYPAPEYALLFEVPDATGGGRRSADAVAMSLWPSRGLEVLGFEFKSYRGDWLREKRNPKKAEEIARFCNRWFIVATPGVVADLSEIPAGWGYLELQPRGLRLQREAPLNKEAELPKRFVASLLRRACQAQVADVEHLSRELVDKARADEREHSAHKISSLEGELKRLRSTIATFEKASGVRIDCFTADATPIGAAVALVNHLGVDRVYGLGEQLQQQAERLARLVKDVQLQLQRPPSQRALQEPGEAQIKETLQIS
jgi:hypothetical protein